MRIFAVGTKILGGATFGGVPPGPNVEPPLLPDRTTRLLGDNFIYGNLYCDIL